ncbi:MAG: hypothetical protein IJ247_02940 [Bacilli bacterium]|nr:hypothetical protein [Bacilli bacterium]
MSEFKGQLLGILLVLAIFGAMAGILVKTFTEQAQNIVEQTTSIQSVSKVTPHVNID